MMAALIRFSIRFPGVVIGFALIILLYATFKIRHSPLNVFPEFSPTQVIIQTESPGFSAELVEALVSKPIENSISGTIGIKQIRSQSIPGLSVVTVIFDDSTDILMNRQSISERLSTLSNLLPREIIPIITPLTSSASSVLGIGITSTSKSLSELRTIAETIIIPQLMSVSGVADVNRFGGLIKQFHVEIDPKKLYRHQVTIQQILEAIKRSSSIQGSGYIENDNQRIIINAEGQTKTIEDLGFATVNNINNKAVQIKDVADVKEGYAPSISAVSINGEPGVYLSVQGQLGSNTYKLTQD